MRLLSLKLQGQYKGLKDQTFSFEDAQGKIIAFIGLNGSGKSQLLELIAESFAYLERYRRADFKGLNLAFGVSVIYKIQMGRDQDSEGVFQVEIDNKGKVQAFVQDENAEWVAYSFEVLPLPDFIIGYASGTNENLQRPFMKNSYQYFDVMRVRMNRRKKIQNSTGIGLIADINEWYLKRYPGVFKRHDHQARDWADYFLPAHEIVEADTPASSLVLIDYDSAHLVVASLAVLPSDEINKTLSELSFNSIHSLTVAYDLRKEVFEEDSIKDIQLLLRIASQSKSKYFEPLCNKTDDKKYDEIGLDYLAGRIIFDLTNVEVNKAMNDENSGDPVRFFNRLNKLHLLGSKSWSPHTKTNIQKSGFIGTVKKPLKLKTPLVVDELILKDKNGRCVDFNDISDGEAQLIQILAAVRIFSQYKTLFLLDEPETHLNPAWKTYFHSYIEDITRSVENNVQLFISTHSPFMVSSLKRNNVFQFRRNNNNLVGMNMAQNETYGASFDVLIKDLFELRSLISHSVIDEIRKQLAQGDFHAKNWIEENLGLSAEKAYLLRMLSE